MSQFGYLRLGANRYRERFGLSFEDVRDAGAGMRIHHRPGADISQQDNQLDSLDLINNAQLHYDTHYAAQTAWQKPLGVSTVTVQRLFGMTSRSWYRRRRLRAIDSIAVTKPVFGGDTLYASSTVTDVHDSPDPDAGEVSLTIDGTNQRGELCATIKCRLEVYREGRHPEDDAAAVPAEDPRFRLYHDGPDGALVEQTGLYFEDLVAGETFVHWPGRAVGADESASRALRSLEINPRWFDSAYVAKHGLSQEVWEPFVLSAVTALTTRTMGRVMANLGWTGIELPRPVHPGDTLYAESTIGTGRLSKSQPALGIAEVETRGYLGTGELVCRYQRSLLVYCRGQGPYEAAGY